MNHQFQTHDGQAPAPKWWDHPERSCAGTPEELWFPLDTHRGRRNFNRDSDVGKAQALCAACPFLIECADDVLAHGDRNGIRAGVLLSSSRAREQLDRAKQTWHARRARAERVEVYA
ncbi:hypothetical protein GS907_24485 [Rhodococcus hoagii]|nr:hypothetical protein [Prescottella equi]